MNILPKLFFLERDTAENTVIRSSSPLIPIAGKIPDYLNYPKGLITHANYRTKKASLRETD